MMRLAVAIGVCVMGLCSVSMVGGVEWSTRGLQNVDLVESSQQDDTNNRVVIFTAWHSIQNLTSLIPRFDHHAAYAAYHDHKYVLFIAENITEMQHKVFVKRNIDVVVVPGFATKFDFQPQRKKLQNGWLKVEAFKLLFQLYKQYGIFFYVDLDVVFYNFQERISKIIDGKPQSIFIQYKDPNRHFSQSQAVVIRNTEMGLLFVNDWLSQLPFCPNINMEQGAYMLSIARFLTACSLNNKTACKTHCEDFCVSPRHAQGRNNKFYKCISKLLSSLNAGINGHQHSHLYIYHQVPHHHMAPRDGFSIDTLKYDTRGSCPLTIHPCKVYNEVVVPNMDRCKNTPLHNTSATVMSKVYHAVRSATKKNNIPKSSHHKHNRSAANALC